MLPLRRCARTCAGRAGSVSGTVIWLSDWATNSCSPSIRIAIIAEIKKVRLLCWFIDLLVAFENAYFSIQIFSFDFGAPRPNPASGEAVGMKDELAVAVLGGGCRRRQRGHGKIAIDPAVHVLEAEIGGEPAGKV